MGASSEVAIHGGEPTYVPALNRAGWYKFLFIDLLSRPETLERLLTAFCQDTYNPQALNQPDVHKWNRNEVPGLQERARSIVDASFRRVLSQVPQV